MNCCIDYYKIGCFNACDCIPTAILLPQVGIHVVTYWYSNDNNRGSFEYESIGDTELFLPPDILNAGYPIYFEILQPDNSYLAVISSEYNNITHITSEIEYKCFWAETFQFTHKLIQTPCNPDVTPTCSDCNIDHEFITDTTLITSELNPGGTTSALITFTKEPCAGNIELSYSISYDGGGNIIPSLLAYTPSTDYSAGFQFSITVPNSAPVGDTYIVQMVFVAHDTANNCYSNTQTVNYFIPIIAPLS